MSAGSVIKLEKLMKEAGLHKYSLPQLVGKKFAFIPSESEIISLGGDITGFAVYEDEIILSVGPIIVQQKGTSRPMKIECISFSEFGGKKIWTAQHFWEGGSGRPIQGKLQIL